LDNPETGENRLMCNRRFQTRRAAGSMLPNDSCRVRPDGIAHDDGMVDAKNSRRQAGGARRGDGLDNARTSRGQAGGMSRADGMVDAKNSRRQADGARRGDGLHHGAAYGSAMRGFSLIEIILVVVLIGGIVAFAASRILGGGDRAKANLARAQVQTLAEKVQQYEMDTGTLPGSLDALVANPGNATGWLGPYAKPVELRDPWNHPYEYRVPGDGQAFDLISLGKDGQAGGESVDGDVKYQ
jgi:general secretion pathway protein G